MMSTQRSALSTRGIRYSELAFVELASSKSVRDINRDAVLAIIRSQQPVARADLARASGLHASTVSAIVKQLINEKWVKEGTIARRPLGRYPRLLSLNDELVILAADVNSKQATIALLDLNGRFLALEVVPLVSEPEDAIGKIVLCMESMRANHPRRSFQGIGISMPGRIDPESQRLLQAPKLKWDSFDIAGAIKKRMRLQVELTIAANACLLAEQWSGKLDGIRNAVLIMVSEGIGAAILANGQIITNRNGLAGGFGHYPIDPKGPLCGCGQRGCWEVFASSNAALLYYAEMRPKDAAHTIHELLRMTEEENRVAIAAVSRQATYLGRGLRFVTAALSPEVILIAGDITASWARFGPVIQAELGDTMLAGHAPQLETANDDELARLRGAAAVVLQRQSGFLRSTWKGN